jgi:hypothetical protein
VAEEFVDLYEVLELPVDADRNTLRKRINELYLDAQRNLDHRNFATRVKYQELFEVTMPQARYILLDDARRDEYDRLVHAYRNNKNGTPIPPSAPQAASAPRAEVNPNASLPGDSGPKIEPLPVEVDPEKLAKEREELWKKWKSGLEEALTTESETRPKARSAATASPTSFSLQPEAPAPAAPTSPASIQAKIQPAPVETAPTPSSPAPAAAPAPVAPAPTVAPAAAAHKPVARPKVDISADFEQKAPAAPAAPAGPGVAPAPSGWVDTGTGELELTMAEIEERRNEHRRQIMKEMLVNVGMIWGSIGALIIFVPGFLIMVGTVGHYYPRNAPPLLKYSPNFIWIGGSIVILALSFFVAQALSKSMRRKRATQMAALTYEELLKHLHKPQSTR